MPDDQSPINPGTKAIAPRWYWVFTFIFLLWNISGASFLVLELFYQ